MDREARKQRRERFLILGVSLFFVLTTYFEFRLSSLSSRLPFVNSIFFFGLINFNIVLLMILVLLIARNVGKLFLERRRQALGARLKTKLVLAFLSFTIIPTVILFLISSFYINSSFDKWFSIKIQNTLQTTLEITQTYYKNTSRVAQYLANQVSKEVHEGWGTQKPRITTLKQLIERSRRSSSVDGIELYLDPLEERVVSGENEQVLPRLPLDVLSKVFKGETVGLVQHIGGMDLIRAASPIYSSSHSVRGVVAVTYAIPVSLVNRVDAISSVFQDYRDVNPLKYPVKSTYFLILVMMTTLILFVSIWIGLYLARELTVPLERLVTATQKVGQGDLDFQILNTGHDEIARLTESFNQMMSELKRHRVEIESTNLELAEKRTYVETILNSVIAGVISVDSNGIVTTMNPSASKLLNLENNSVLGQDIRRLSAVKHIPFSDMIEQLKRQGDSPAPVQKQFPVDEDEGSLTLTATASAFRAGIVFVIDDTSYMAKVQREAAWREVARRIAHEIKNPLTPIKLSAQRLLKRFGTAGEESAIVRECTETIIKNVDELKDMVNEFSSFARFPSANPSPNDLNEVIREVVVLYEAAHRGIQFEFQADKQLSLVLFDRDQIKRVLINLFDNSIAALSSTQNPRMFIRTERNLQLNIAVIEVGDNGSGMSETVQNRLFEPYFSTKKTGTGLGLSIVKRIISDHAGFIRVQSIPGSGSKFTIELPINLNQKDSLGIKDDGTNSTYS